MTPTEVELRWLEYARRVVNVRNEHLRACAASGGLSDSADGSGQLRWPGYLGAEYQSGQGVLCVGQVHRDVNAAAEHANPDVNRRYVAATAKWKAGEISDEAFLAEARLAYEYWISRWVSPAWTTFRYLLRELGLSVPQIAYTNLAKCQLPLGPRTTGIVRVCQQEYPMCELVRAIQPAAVFCARHDAFEGGETVKTWCTERAYAFDYRTGEGVNRGRESRGIWGPRAIAAIRERDPER